MKNKYRNTDSAIKAGALLLTEEPYAFVLSSNEKGLRCDFCIKKGKVLKCSGCQFVHYCGRVCQKDAWNDHKWECSNLKRIAPKVIPDAARLMSKIISRQSKGDGNTYRAFYSANSFRMWKDLMSHYSDLKADKKRMDHFTSLCMVLYEFMRDTSLPNAVELMGIYGRMVINSFTILDVDMNSVGTGIYLGCSVLDHSCKPNAVATFEGKTINIRATEDMPCLDWNQLRISYIDLMKTPRERQDELKRSYYFLCQCDRCLDETQIKYVHAAKCPNGNCENPIQIPWKDNLQLVIRSDENQTQNGYNQNNENDGNNHGGNNANGGDNEHGGSNQNESDNKNRGNNQHSGDNQNGGDNQHGGYQNGGSNQNGGNPNCSGDSEYVLRCSECSTKYDEQKVEVFKKTMEFTEAHLQNMKDASVAYVDVCKYCLQRQEGVLHPLNVMYAQTLDHAFDALILVQAWDQASEYAESLLPCFRFYYGERHPLLGLLHLKYGKILLYKNDSKKAFHHLQSSEKILKITHGDRHPLYKELLPLLKQASVECLQ